MGKTTKYILYSAGILIVLLLIGKATGIIGQVKKTQVATEKASVRVINETVSASGKIKPEVEVGISSEVSGEIVDLPIKEGDVVKKGQLLVRIRPDILKSGYERAVASYLVSLYCSAADDDGYVAERYRDRLPKARIGKSCVTFKTLADLDEGALVALIEQTATMGVPTHG